MAGILRYEGCGWLVLTGNAGCQGKEAWFKLKRRCLVPFLQVCSTTMRWRRARQGAILPLFRINGPAHAPQRVSSPCGLGKDFSAT